MGGGQGMVYEVDLTVHVWGLACPAGRFKALWHPLGWTLGLYRKESRALQAL